MTGAAALVFTNTTNGLMQLSTEPAMRGRVMARRVGVALGDTPIGAPIVGWVANHLGPRWALGIGAASGAAAAIVAILAAKSIAGSSRSGTEGQPVQPQRHWSVNAFARRPTRSRHRHLCSAWLRHWLDNVLE